MTVQMLIIVEMRDRYALAECLQAYTERVGPLLGKTQGLHAAYLAGEEGESTLAIVTLFWTSREAAVAWLNSGGDTTLQGTLCPYSLGEVILKFFRVEHEHEKLSRRCRYPSVFNVPSLLKRSKAQKSTISKCFSRASSNTVPVLRESAEVEQLEITCSPSLMDVEQPARKSHLNR